MLCSLLTLGIAMQAATSGNDSATDRLQSPAPGGEVAAGQEAPGDAAPVRRPLNPDRPPLLREGTLLSRALGTVAFDEGLGCWTFTNEVAADRRSQGFQRTFCLMPSRVLEEFIAHRRSEHPASRFEFSGTVTIYDGTNFLLPSVITPLAPVVDPDPESRPSPAPRSDDARSPENTLRSGTERIADRLELRLRDRVGYLPMSLDLPEVEGADHSRLVADGTRIQNRPGTIVRDQNSGTWRFIFGAQGAGSRDPSLELLPCLQLQAIENLAMRSELSPRIHASGEVTTFNGRNYLMLSRWVPATRPSNLVR